MTRGRSCLLQIVVSLLVRPPPSAVHTPSSSTALRLRTALLSVTALTVVRPTARPERPVPQPLHRHCSQSFSLSSRCPCQRRRRRGRPRPGVRRRHRTSTGGTDGVRPHLGRRIPVIRASPLLCAPHCFGGCSGPPILASAPGRREREQSAAESSLPGRPVRSAAPERLPLCPAADPGLVVLDQRQPAQRLQPRQSSPSPGHPSG